MKKLIVVLLLIPICLNAQEYKFKIKEDAINHFGFGAVIGGFSQCVLYQQTGSKFWSFVGGNVAALGCGIIKESIDTKFSNRDLRNTILGSLNATITVRLIIGKSILKKDCTIAQLFEAELYE